MHTHTHTHQKTSSPSDQLQKRLTAQFSQLLAQNWIELWSYRNGDQSTKGAVAFSITPNGAQDYRIASKLSFGIRCRHNLTEKVLIEQ